MIVVSTPTGHIGSQLVPHLLAAGASVRVIARKPEKLAPAIRGRVEIVQGSTDDIHVLSRAVERADELFWAVPPSFQASDLNEDIYRFTRPLCEAIEAQGVKRIVAVSSLGRGRAKSALLTSSFAMDAMIEQTGVLYRSLQPAAFMENMLRQIESIRHQGMFVSPGRPDVKMPVVATRDIAALGANVLLDPSWEGQDGLAVLGPEDLSNNDMAEIISEVLGKPIRYRQIPVEDYGAQLIRYGGSAAFAQGILDLQADIDELGIYNVERTAENTMPTTFRRWCEQVLKPAVLDDDAA